MNLKNPGYKTASLLFDLIYGYNIRQASARALEFDFLTRDQIEAYHQQKFSELSLIASKSEYYQVFKNKPLNEYPLINRVEYQKNIQRMKTHYKHPYQICQSSGSTGLPVHQYVTRDMLLAKRSSHIKMLNWYGLEREDPEFKLGGLPADLKTKLYYLLRNKRYYHSHIIKEESLKKIINHYNRFKPRILYGYPSTISNFLMYAYRHNIALHQPDIIVTHAENLYKEIECNFKLALPGSKIVNQYWSTEANIAETCPCGKLHIDEDTVICEVINQDKNGYGDLYITNLFSYVVPIIRYNIGDRVKISHQPCVCGRNTKVIESLEGRENEFLELPDGNRFPITAINDDSFAENILYYQLLYHKTRKQITFRYIPINENLPIQKEIVLNYLKDKFNLGTEFEQVSCIDYSNGGKSKRLINLE
jgi:phenylacetate-coenzyme A ligase PaaK-like adenylate-forming protein